MKTDSSFARHFKMERRSPARGTPGNGSEASPSTSQVDTEDIEAAWSRKRAALAAARRGNALGELEARLERLVEGAHRANQRGDARLEALLHDLKLAEREDDPRGEEKDTPPRASPSPPRERQGARPRPFGGGVYSSDEESDAGSDASSSSGASALDRLDRRARAIEDAPDGLSASRAAAVLAALGRARSEMDEERASRDAMFRELAAARALVGDAATNARALANLRAEVDDARRNEAAALELAGRREAELKRTRARGGGSGDGGSELDAERARRAESERALAETRRECARAYERASISEKEATEATHEARSAQRELADVRAALRDATAARDRAEKEARERREEAAAAAAEAGASSRRAETREDTVRALRRRCEDQERELGALRKYVRAQREDVEAAARAILGIERARAGLK